MSYSPDLQILKHWWKVFVLFGAEKFICHIEIKSMVFGQVVIGPPGSGKTTYCNGMSQFLKLIGRYFYLCLWNGTLFPWHSLTCLSIHHQSVTYLSICVAMYYMRMWWLTYLDNFESALTWACRSTQTSTHPPTFMHVTFIISNTTIQVDLCETGSSTFSQKSITLILSNWYSCW